MCGDRVHHSVIPRVCLFPVYLEIPELVDFFVGEVPDSVVRGYRLIFEKFGQTVVRTVETSFDVEFAFELENVFAEGNEVVAGHGDAGAGVEHVDQGRQTLGNIEGRKGHEDTHAGGVDR